MKETTRSYYAAAVERACRRIRASLDTALDLHALAREASASSFHFHRIFRGMVGETPLEMHRRLRLERAAARLLDSDASVTTIAFESGFETHEAFTRAFRRAFAEPPTAFRERLVADDGCARRPQTRLAAPCGLHYDTEPAELSMLGMVSTMHVSIEPRPAIRIAAVRHRGPYPTISQAFAKLGAAAGPAGLIGPSTVMLAIYYDDPDSTPPEELRSDAGISVPEEATLPAGVDEQRVPAGQYARYLHVGPYSGLGDAWSRLMGQWLPGSGHRIGEGATYEVYLDDPRTTPPDQLRTELYLSIA